MKKGYILSHTVREATSDKHSIVFVNRSRHWMNNEIKRSEGR